MKLIPKSIKIPALGDTESESDPVVMIKLFHPFSLWTWYVLEYSPEENLCFGLVSGHEVELGYFSIDELSELKINGLGVERDLHWSPVKLSILNKMIKNHSV